MIELIDTGIVYRNPRPYLRAVHAWHPSVVAFDDGEIVASFDLGQAVESLDYRTHLSRSADGGRTWTPPERVLADPPGRPTSHTLRISRLADGGLVAFGGLLYRDDPDEGVVNHENLGYTPMDLVWLQSKDRGRTWDGPRLIRPPLVGPGFETCHPIVELPDGRWLAPTSTWKGWNGEVPNGMQAVALVSRDKGRTWPEYLSVMDGRAEGILYWEQSLVRLPDGRLAAIVWVFHEPSGRSLPNRFALSADGRTFGPPRPAGLNGQTAKMLVLADDRILCLYRREDKPGLWANLSRIEGDDWINLEELRLWHGAAAGMSGDSSAGEELSALKFGYPSMARLPNGEVLALFWCSEDAIHNIRWLRIKIT